MVLKSLYEKVLEKPLTTDEDGPAQLLPHLVKALKEVVEGIGPWLRRRLVSFLQLC